MAAGDKIAFSLSAATHGSAFNARRAEVEIRTAVGQSRTPTACVGGVGKVQVQKTDIEIVVGLDDLNDALERMAAVSANLVLTANGVAGSETHTLKNVKFHSFLGRVMFRDPDDGGMTPLIGIAGTCEWGDSDTVALMWTRT